VKLDQFLGGLSVDQLRELADVWTPDEAMSSSKSALFRALRTEMTRPARAARCLEFADTFGRGIVRKLLRSEDVSQSVAVLAASASARPKSLEEARAAVTELGAMGLVCVESEKRWEAYGSAKVSIPDELVAPLRAATGIDDRSWEQILNLSDHLAALSGKELAALLKKLGIGREAGAALEDMVARLAEPASCMERIGSLSPEVRELVLAAVHDRAGIVPVAALGKLGMEPPGKAAAAALRRQLESSAVGTIGDVSLLQYGIDLDGRVLVVFTEVAEALLSAPPDGDVNLPDPVGPDFLLDLSELVASVRESGAKLKASGALTGAAAHRIIAKLNRPELPLTDAADLLDLRLACAEKLGLIERVGDSLAVRRSAWRWERRSYEEKAADLFGQIGFALPAPHSTHHHDGLCETAAGLLRSMRPGEWRRGGALAHVAMRRYLAGLGSSDLRERVQEDVHDVAKYVLPPFPGLSQLGSHLHKSVVLEAYAMGVLDLAVAGGRATAERLGDFGSVAAGRAADGRAPAKLIASADFEVIILPEGNTTRLRYEIGQFAAREKFEQTAHLRITKERVEEAVVRGLDADDMVRLLLEHSHTGAVPQNVEASIRGWAGRVRVATVEDVHVFELGDEELLDVVAEMPALKELVVRRVSPTALALAEWPSDRKLLADLCRLGVYVR